MFPGGVRGGRCLGLTTLPPSYADCQIWMPQLPGTLWHYLYKSAQGLQDVSFTSGATLDSDVVESLTDRKRFEIMWLSVPEIT
jgi:hypothetical protein